MQIINNVLTFKRPHTVRRATKRIVVHHTAGHDNSVPEIHQMHLNRGWTGIGYHYIIRANGSIERGRPEHVRGAHAGDANVDSIGIGLTGNFERAVPRKEQMDALVWLIGDIRRRLGQDISVIRHSDVMATACPGRLFPWAELQARLTQPVPPAAQPNEALYTVRAGDTLWSIAAARLGNGTRATEIQRLNNLSTTVISAGQRLRLPV